MLDSFKEIIETSCLDHTPSEPLLFRNKAKVNRINFRTNIQSRISDPLDYVSEE